MKKLSEMKAGVSSRIIDIKGETRFLSRITSIGIIPGSIVEIVKNTKKQPMLIYGRDTLIAINRMECEQILVEELKYEPNNCIIKST